MATKKQKKCRVCKDPFTPNQIGQKVCGIDCARELVRRENKKAWDAETRRRKKALREQDRSHHLREAQKSFNKYIRLRDRNLPCISCGTQSAKWDAGHYRTTGAAPELRFDEDNCHKQCMHCNSHRSGNIVPYRQELLRRIGEARLEALEGPHEPKKYTIDDLKAIRKEYDNKAAALIVTPRAAESF